MEVTLEKIELVKDRTGVTYKEAKEALEAADGNVVDAIVSIEDKTDGETSSQKISQKGNEIMVVNLDETEVLQKKRAPGRSITFFVRITASIDRYVLFRAETPDGPYTEVFRSKSGLDLKLTDKAPAKLRKAYYIIKCARDFDGNEYLSDGTAPICIKY